MRPRRNGGAGDRVKFVVGAVLVMSCAPATQPAAPQPKLAHKQAKPTRVTQSLAAGPLTDFLPAAGLRWLLVASPERVLRTLGTHATSVLGPVWLRNLKQTSGIDLALTDEALIAGFDYATLYLASTSGVSLDVVERFERRAVLPARRTQPHPQLLRSMVVIDEVPETLVHARDRWVAWTIGDPTPAKVAELFALGKLHKTVTALDGVALSTLPHHHDGQTLRFYVPGPIPAAWTAGGRSLLTACTALSLRVALDVKTVELELVLSGRWQPEDAKELVRLIRELSRTTFGDLVGLSEAEIAQDAVVSGDSLTVNLTVAARRLTQGITALLSGNVRDIIGLPSSGPALAPGLVEQDPLR